MMTPNNLELTSHLAVSWALFGLIWTVQLSHYPGFHFIANDQWQAFHNHHRSSITIIVMPLMLLELGLACWLVFRYGWTWTIPLVMVLAIWASTFFISVPLHGKLGAGKDTAIISQLVSTNWIRTILWTAKALWASWIFWIHSPK
jgi:hypothetical protein